MENSQNSQNLTIEKSASFATLPWYWSAWQAEFLRHLEKLKNSVFLQVEELEKINAGNLENHLSQLNEAERIFVDFFPDEISTSVSSPVFEQLRPNFHKMVLLPPAVAMPTKLGAVRHKPVLLSDSAIDTLSIADPLSTDKRLNGIYTAGTVPYKPFEAAFERQQISTINDLCEVINAPSWILFVKNPQVEQALWQLAGQYGIKTVFWEAANVSAHRLSAGYKRPTDTNEDRTLKERFRRVKNVSAVIVEKSSPETLDILKIQETMSFVKLGLVG